MVSSEDDEPASSDWRQMRRVAAKPRAAPTHPPVPKPDASVQNFCPVFVKPSSVSASENPKERTLKKGEFGKDPEQLAQLEKSGYVMSGARNTRIAMIRELKQQAEVVSEEQRQEQVLVRMKERDEREDALIEGFRELLKSKRKLEG